MFGSGRRRAGFVTSIALAALAVACTPPKAPSPRTAAYDTPGVYEFTVPAGVTQLLVSAAGGAGGSFPSPTGQQSPVPGGRGGQAVAAIAVTPGEVLTVGVGGRAFDGTQPAPGLKCLQAQGGANGGGAGGEGFNSCGGGGGGWSGLARGSQSLLVAAGGGGAGGGRTSQGGGGAGGAGGGTEGLPGAAGTNLGVGSGAGGGGGTQSAGGSGGAGAAAGAGANGTAGTGGQGGDHASTGGISGGGGGGGFRGGGGGGAGFGYFAGGGGGGSGFGPPGTVFETGVRAGNGVVLIAW